MDLIKALANEQRSTLQEWCRSRSQTVSCGDPVALSRVLGKYLMYLDMTDVSVAPHLALDGFWEMWVTQCICRQLLQRPKRYAIDVGANVGYYTLLLADLVGPKGHVQAFEPQSRLARVLRQSIQVNGFTGRAEVHRCALGDRHAYAQLSVADSNLGSVSLGEYLPEHSRSSVPDTTVHPYDDFSHAMDRVDFVKIDSEGHEPQVLQGMAATLKRNPEAELLIEWTPCNYPDRGRPFAGWLQERAFVAHRVGEDGDLHQADFEELCKIDGFEMVWLSKQALR